MLSLLTTLFFFLLALSVLIAFHEFGHFYVARKCKVHVIRFSIGFGKPLFRWVDKKGTEFVLSAIPLGGYVKMLGESTTDIIPPALKTFSFSEKTVWARMSIIAAGPVFNLILAFFALWGMFMIGITSIAPVIGSVQPGSPAKIAHLKSMDEIMSINDEDVNTWQDVQRILVSSIGNNTPLVFRLYNLKTSTYHFSELNENDLTLENKDIVSALGITPAYPTIPPVIGKVLKNNAGAEAGLRKNDRFLSINGEKIKDWIQVVPIVQANPNQKLSVVILRDGEKQEIELYPKEKVESKQSYGFIGVEAEIPHNFKAIWLRKEHYSFFGAIKPALNQTISLINMSINMIGKLVTGSISIKNIGGPIGMAQLTSQAIHLGVAYYLSFIALVSVSLGVLNLLPIPILDGGHLLYCVFEVILRRPLSEEVRLMGARVGFIVLVALMAVAIFNDIGRMSLSWNS
jgi:regulator of sigma E protease